MKQLSHSRSLSASAIMVASATLLAACASTTPAPSQPNGPIMTTPRPNAVVNGPVAANFLERPVAVFESAVGAPALIRKEGDNEFRRYDLNDCRAYAVVDRNGRVKALSSGPSLVGAAAIPFERCLANAGG